MAFLGRKKVDEDKGDDFIGAPDFIPGFAVPVTPSFDYTRPAPLQVDTVDPLAALRSPVDKHIMPVQNAETDLAFLRQMYPFVPIMPFPNFCRAVALAANTNTDVQCGNHSLVKFKGNGDYYVSMQGRASVPIIGDPSSGNQSIYKPEDEWFYIGGVSQISLIAPGADIVVNVMFYTTNNRPKVA